MTPVNPLDYAFYTFEPRPDQPNRYDEQTAFMDSRHAGLTACLGGNGSGKSVCALAKAVDFMLFNEPIRKDFPFWIISNTFEQVMEICWKEKLHQQGHLPPHFVDWGRIRWYDRKSDWPHSVPLVPYRGTDKNWVIRFKSQDQGREVFQGESIGGFLFTEQFHHELLIEVMARCRDYGGYGNKIAEFCPINPEKSIWLQEMDESGTIPESWGLYHTNTECAVEAGQFDANLFQDMFAMVPESMKATRMKGLWGAYEGLVYPEFNPAIHCLPEDWEIPHGCYHRRFLDWGAGPHNPFACLWACRNARGQWFIYDEYYSTEPIDAFKHLMAIQDRWPWPKHNPYYGVTWADPSEAGWIRAASEMQNYAPGYESMLIQGANNSRDDGINHVKWLLDPKDMLADENGKPQPHLFVVKDRCPNLIREFRTHRYLNPPSSNGNNPRTPAAEVLKANDHALDALRYGVYSEASQTGLVPRTIARQHSPGRHGVQISSSKFQGAK